MTTPTIQSPDVSGQQVFRQMPTNDQLHAMADQLGLARKARAKFLVLSIFLAGAVLACVAGIAVLYGHMNTRLAEAGRAEEALEARIAAKDRQIVSLNATIDRQAATIASYADFQSIAALQEQIVQLESDIAGLLVQPSRANAPARLKDLPDEVEWLDSAVATLRTRRDALARLKAEIEAWPPPLGNPRPD